MPGMNAVGNEHGEQHQGDGDDRRGHLRHGLFRCFRRGQLRFRFEDVLDGFDDDNRIVDDDADRQNQCQQRNRIGRKAEREHHGESADKRHRHGNDRDQG
jgi:hypothetical protein